MAIGFPRPVATSDDPTAIFEQYPVASFAVRGDPIYFAVESIEEDGGNRIVRRRRPYRDGAKLDDTGSNEKVFTLTARANDVRPMREAGARLLQFVRALQSVAHGWHGRASIQTGRVN
jgi:hypothetical protein